MKPLFLIVAYLAAVTLPLLLSAWVGGPPRQFHQELASGFGILAFSMILVEFILSGRFRAISNDVGMDVTMRFHQVMARRWLLLCCTRFFTRERRQEGSAHGTPRVS